MDSENSVPAEADPRPPVTGMFVEPDEEGARLFLAIGRAVVGAGALEAALRVEAARLLYTRAVTDNPAGASTLGQELRQLDKLPAGGLRTVLQSLGVPEDLDQRIKDAIDRRNDLVHRAFEDPELARAINDAGNIDTVIERIDQLALDCGELAVELQVFSVPKLFELTGRSPAEVLDLVTGVDPTTVTDPRERKQLEAVRALIESQDASTLFQDLGITETTEDPIQEETEPGPHGGNIGPTRAAQEACRPSGDNIRSA